MVSFLPSNIQLIYISPHRKLLLALSNKHIGISTKFPGARLWFDYILKRSVVLVIALSSKIREWNLEKTGAIAY